MSKTVNTGFGNIVSLDKVVGVFSPESAPIKRIISEARDGGNLVDATYGRKTRAVIVTDSLAGWVVLSPIEPETLGNRMNPPESR